MSTKIIFNDDQIKHDTGKASLIKVPHSQKQVWIPDSMIWPYKTRTAATIYPDFEYHTAGGLKMTAEELVEAFGKNVVITEYHKPERLNAKEVATDDSLKR